MDASAIVSKVQALESANVDRDSRHKQILAIREGDYDAVAPGILPDDFDKPLVANLIDTTAHDLAEVMAPLPSINCAPLSMSNNTAQKFADKRTKIARGYVDRSRLQDQLLLHGADRFNSLGFMALIAELDFDAKSPCLRISDVPTTYYVNDYWGRTHMVGEVFYAKADELCLLYPEYTEHINRAKGFSDTDEIKLIRWVDKHCYALVAYDLQLQLDMVEHGLDECPARVVERPKIGSTPRGQFDDVIWVQIARALTAFYTMDALEQSVHAPLAVPSDVQSVEIGPNAVLRSDNPGQIGRVRLDISPGLFPEQQILAQEQRVGSRYPEGRSGSIDASIITGQGVQALMGTFDTQIKTFQTLMVSALVDVLGHCFALDEKWWPNTEKTVRGKDQGSPYEVTYVPSKDIAGDYTVDVSYGAVAGLDPNRALVFILQGLAGGLLSRDTAMRALPNIDINVAEETRNIDLEKMREGLLGMFVMMPQLALQGMQMGQDPREFMQQLVDAADERKKGKSLEEIVKKVFLPKEKEQPAPAADPLAALMGGGAPAGPQSPAGDLLMSLTGMTPEGDPNLQSTVSRRQPI